MDFHFHVQTKMGHCVQDGLSGLSQNLSAFLVDLAHFRSRFEKMIRAQVYGTVNPG